MRKLTESLNMFFLDYLIIPVWAVFSTLGNIRSARIMVPVTIVFLALNYFNTRNTTKLFLLDINLATASVAGIILNSFLYLKFIYADPKIVADMVTIIFLYTFFHIAACIICLTIKAIMHKRNMRIISRMAEGAYDADDDDTDYYDEDEYEDEDEDDEEVNEEGSGFFTSIKNLLKSRAGDEEEDDGDNNDEDEPEDDDYEKPEGPKFRVVKK